ncbi:phosphotransferase [Altericista sp. CCNU0014]|uniref:phosphotransferase n=1 Tax=Altericista sp. CCNU0014 TaxID=3082949 RepID=UPI00384CCB08
MLTQTIFPVTYSTLACEALQRQILPLFGVGPVVQCHFWNRGLSDIYLVETLTARYVLRISHTHWRTKSETEFELELLNYLKRCGVPVSAPLHATDGNLFVEIRAPEGFRYAALFPYAPGRIPIGDLSVKQGYKLGEAVAHLHEAAAEFYSCAHRQPLSLEYLLDESFGVIEPYLRFRSEDLAYLRSTIDQIKNRLCDLPQRSPYWTICWGDPHSGNVHFTADNQLTLFDFDQCGYGWRAFEMAKFLQVSIRTGIARKVRDAFFQGYQSRQVLTPLELETLQPFTQAAHLWNWCIALEASKIHSCSRLDEYFFMSRLQQLKMLQTPEWQLF